MNATAPASPSAPATAAASAGRPAQAATTATTAPVSRTGGPAFADLVSALAEGPPDADTEPRAGHRRSAGSTDASAADPGPAAAPADPPAVTDERHALAALLAALGAAAPGTGEPDAASSGPADADAPGVAAPAQAQATSRPRARGAGPGAAGAGGPGAPGAAMAAAGDGGVAAQAAARREGAGTLRLAAAAERTDGGALPLASLAGLADPRSAGREPVPGELLPALGEVARPALARSDAGTAALAIAGDLAASFSPAPDAAGPVHQADLASHPQEAAFATELATQVEVMLRDGAQEAQLHLNPVDLGPIRIELRLDGQTADIHLRADHAETRAGMHQALEQLRDMLAAQGLSLGQAQVGTGQRESPGSSPAPARGGRSVGAAPAAVEAGPVRIAAPRGLLDLYA